MDGRTRDIQIKFRVDREEKELIKLKMKQLNTSNMEAYLRKMAIDGFVIKVDTTDIRGQTAEIQKIGVNINQIAKRINTTDNIYKEDIDELKELMNEIWRLQRLNLLKQP